MPSVRFTCPTHLEEVDSGIDLDEHTFTRNRLTIVNASCPLCEHQHRFLLADARLDEKLSHLALAS
jgi:hypothetical protein